MGSGVHDLNLALVAAAADGDSVAVRASLRAGADVHFLDDAALCASRRLGAGKVRLSVAAMHWSPRRARHHPQVKGLRIQNGHRFTTPSSAGCVATSSSLSLPEDVVLVSDSSVLVLLSSSEASSIRARRRAALRCRSRLEANTVQRSGATNSRRISLSRCVTAYE